MSTLRGIPGFGPGQQGGLALAAIVLLVSAVVFGGASRQHELRLAIVELSALPLLILATQRLAKTGAIQHRGALALAGAVAILPLLQLVPLPPAIWTGLPGRSELVLALDLSGVQQGWLPLSLTPDRTWRSFLALLPPISMFLGVLALEAETRLRLIKIVLGATLVAILLGAAQLASGGQSLYPWATTDAGNVTGFFANRNHLATLCLVGLPFATVLGMGGLRRQTGSRFSFWFAVAFVALVAVALGVIRSRAGIVLFLPIMGCSLAAAWAASGRGRPRALLLALMSGVVVAVTAVALFAAGPLLDRFGSGAREGRFENWPTVLEAADAYLPFGSGFGSFDAVYRSVEPLERLDPTYFNQAHNDYLETWLEAGWPGAALIILFLIWFVRRTWAAWRSGVTSQRDLQRAASIAVGAVLLHSAADYPLRTAAMATIFALCVGLLELAVRSDAELGSSRGRSRRRA